MAESGEAIQKKADTLREEGKTIEALSLYNEALLLYQKGEDYRGVLRVLSGRLISWQHLYNHGENKLFAILARKEAEAMLEVSQHYKIEGQDHLNYFFYGKTCIFLKDFKSAEEAFRKAVDLFPDESGEKGDWLAHLGEALYKNGKKEEGERVILQGIDYMRDHSKEIDSFRINVWISGAYLRLSKILLADGRINEAIFYLQKGEEIVLSDSRLVIRKEQLEILKKKLKGQEKLLHFEY